MEKARYQAEMLEQVRLVALMMRKPGPPQGRVPGFLDEVLVVQALRPHTSIGAQRTMVAVETAQLTLAVLDAEKFLDFPLGTLSRVAESTSCNTEPVGLSSMLESTLELMEAAMITKITSGPARLTRLVVRLMDGGPEGFLTEVVAVVLANEVTILALLKTRWRVVLKGKGEPELAGGLATEAAL